MTDAQQALAQVREALAAGPTPGEWYVRTNRHPTTDGRSWGWLDAAPPGGPQRSISGVRVEWEGGDTSAVNARYLAACSPANVAAILAHVEAQEAEIERLTAALNTCVWALRQPLDDWKGECERKALDEARDALKEQR